MRAALLSFALTVAALPAFAETRCGWIANSSPGNWWLSDADGDWVLMVQGGEPVQGMDLIPDLTEGEWIAMNGSYGYGCACTEMVTAPPDTVLRIISFRQIPLSRCENDPALPGN